MDEIHSHKAQAEGIPLEEGEIEDEDEDEDQAPEVLQSPPANHTKPVTQTRDELKTPAAQAVDAARACEWSLLGPSFGFPVLTKFPLLLATNDPALKSLIMSWYWAGYYTGLHEGRREAGELDEAGQGKEGS